MTEIENSLKKMEVIIEKQQEIIWIFKDTLQSEKYYLESQIASEMRKIEYFNLVMTLIEGALNPVKGDNSERKTD